MTSDAQAAVAAIYDAFNRRDLDALLELSHPDIELHPLRLSPGAVYRGHDGIRALFEEMRALGLDHRFDIAETRLLPGGRVAAIGKVVMGGAATDFVGVHAVAGGRIGLTHHYFSDEDTLARLGLEG
jgi:ketosteroid isomerase-like protein